MFFLSDSTGISAKDLENIISLKPSDKHVGVGFTYTLNHKLGLRDYEQNHNYYLIITVDFSILL